MKIYLVWWYDILPVIKLAVRKEIPWRVSHRRRKPLSVSRNSGSGGKPTRLPSLASFFAIADGLGITPEELIAAMRKEAGVREKSNGERAENDE